MDEVIRIEELPDENDLNAIVAFAASFNGHEHFGSFAACAAEAQSQKRETITDLRNELFFEYRGSHHRGDDAFVETYRSLLPYFRARLAQT